MCADALPFRASVPWADAALFSGPLSCALLFHQEETVAWLKELLDPANAPRVACLRRRTRAAYGVFSSSSENLPVATASFFRSSIIASENSPFLAAM